MRVLLDTHTMLWYFLGENKCSPKVHELIETSDAVYYSVVNLWEIGIKQSVGGYRDLNIPDNWEVLFPKIAKEFDIGCLEITAQDCKTISELESHHRDPFDRMLVAQAMREKVSILSKDKVLDLYPVKRVW